MPSTESSESTTDRFALRLYGDFNLKYGQIGLYYSLFAPELSCFNIPITVLGFSQLEIRLSENCSRIQPLASCRVKWMGLCVLSLAREPTSAVYGLDHGNRVSSYQLNCLWQIWNQHVMKSVLKRPSSLSGLLKFTRIMGLAITSGLKCATK